MRKIFYITLLSAAIMVCLTGCHTLERIYLKGPTKAPAEGPKAVARLPIVNDDLAKSMEDMLKKIDVKFPTNKAQTDLSLILKGCLSFLVCEFGPSIYQGRVVLHITEDPADNAFIIWDESDDVERTITLNHYNVMKPIWHHYLVHELFHAFYQSSEFLKVFPDSIIEGMAIYAQYRYQNREMTNARILEKTYDDTDGLRTYCTQNGFDFDLPFQSYGDEERKYAYLVSGLVFFKQDSDQANAIIQNLLRTSPLSTEKMPFDSIVVKYDLIIDDKDFHRIETPTLALPTPRKIEGNLYQEFNRSVPVESTQIDPNDLIEEMIRPMFDMLDQ